MKLKQLLHDTNVKYSEELGNLEINGISHHSENVEAGNIFVCIKGYNTNGHQYAAAAAEKGAVVVLAEEILNVDGIPVLVAENSRKALSKMAANFYKNEEKPFRLFGVTGTNGKTTVTYMLKSILEADGSACGILGTIGYAFNGKVYEATNTTPEASTLQKFFAAMRDAGIENCAMEVSSHGLAMGKVDDIRFQVTIFTNLTPDHMDYHHNLEDYYQAKKKLFTIHDSVSVINVDDEYGKMLFQELMAAGRNPRSYSLKDKKSYHYGEIVETTERGSTLLVLENGVALGNLSLNTPGVFTIYNGLAALSAARAADIPFPVIQKGLGGLKGVPGRFELVENKKEFIVVVDYAHTPDALEKVLKTASDFKKGRLLCVFGCGGDRDKVKRGLMGEVAGRYSDYCIITSDNPRTEKQTDIAADIEKGIYETGCNYEVIDDRYEAIKRAVSICKKGDVLLIAGKGHETYQIIGHEKTHFDDREVVRKMIEDGG